MQIIGNDSVQGSFKIIYAGITFTAQFYYALGAGGAPSFDVAPLSGGGIEMQVNTPVLAGDTMTCSFEAHPKA